MEQAPNVRRGKPLNFPRAAVWVAAAAGIADSRRHVAPALAIEEFALIVRCGGAAAGAALGHLPAELVHASPIERVERLNVAAIGLNLVVVQRGRTEAAKNRSAEEGQDESSRHDGPAEREEGEDGVCELSVVSNHFKCLKST